MREYGLIDGLNSTRNGFQLCGNCHWWYGQHYWFVEPDLDIERIVVADALLLDEETLPPEERLFSRIHGQPLRLPAPSSRGDGWPTKKMWRVQRELFEAAREARHAAHADALGCCTRCNRPYESLSWPREHEKKCVATRRQKHMVTPAALVRRLTTLLEAAAGEVVAVGDVDSDAESVASAVRDLGFGEAAFLAAHAEAGKP
jgi:hypothetical protein